jgi:hypothetical protein
LTYKFFNKGVIKWHTWWLQESWWNQRQFAGSLGDTAWVTFVAMACFFAAGGKNMGFVKNGLANLPGVLWAMLIFFLVWVLSSLVQCL